MVKPKLAYSSNGVNGHPKDDCQTPPYAFAPLMPIIHDMKVWEPAAGRGMLSNVIAANANTVYETDIKTGLNFLADEYPDDVASIEAIVTNPPFSLKYKFLERCYATGKAFALLMPIDTLGAQTAQRMFDQHGIEVLIMDKRIDFIMPIKGGGGAAQFNSAWFTWGLNIGRQLTFTSIAEAKAAYNKGIV